MATTEERQDSGRSAVIAPVVALVAVGVALVALVVFVLPSALVTAEDVPDAAERLDLENKVRSTLLQGLAGAFLFLTAFFTFQQVRTARQEFDNTRTDREQRAGREERAQITERFVQAIDHLGNDEGLIARLGGVYSLETLGRDNATMAPLVEEVLCAFIRERSPWPPRAGQPGADTPPCDVPGLRERLPDVAAALLVLSRRPVREEPFRSRLWPLDLSYVDLRSADLAAPPFIEPSGLRVKGPERHGNLRGALLAGSHLECARLDDTDLREANLTAADLRGASLVNSDLKGAVLVGAHLEGANLLEAHADPEVANVAEYDAHTRWPNNPDVPR